ncbi:MAG TPA: hypothetical protein VGF71_10440, partial [Caulobacteraceae bacterium]
MLKSRSIRALLAGASVATLTCAVAPSAGAAPLHLGPSGGQTGDYVVSPAQSYGFVLIDDYDLQGSFINEGTLGSSGTTAAILVVGAVITGTLSNAATGKIEGTANGIFLINSTVPNIVNNGSISVVHAGGFGSSITGIVNTESSAASITSTITNNGSLSVMASGHAAGTVFAFTTVTAHGARQQLSSSGDVTAILDNTGTLTVDAEASAEAASYARALARADGFEQVVNSNAGAINLIASNSGDFTVKAHATASGDYAEAQAYGFGILQSGSSFELSAAAEFDNSGTLNVDVGQGAIGPSAYATGVAQGLNQDIESFAPSSVTATNSGVFTVIDEATVNFGGGYGRAVAQAYGATQEAGSQTSETVSMTNSGTFTVEALATAHGSGYATATVFADGLHQTAGSPFIATSTGAISFENTGVFSVDATANAKSTFHSNAVDYFARGIVQTVTAGDGGEISLTNSGTITFAANASAGAAGSAIASGARASPTVFEGLAQFITATATNASGMATISNSGTVNIGSFALASGADYATADAAIDEAVWQRVNAASPVAAYSNNGALTVLASAEALSPAGSTAVEMKALAHVTTGIDQYVGADVGKIAEASLDNSGSISIEAEALADPANTAVARAIIGSIEIDDVLPAIATATAGTVTGGFGGRQQVYGGLTDTALVTNSGTMNVVAQATADGLINADAFAYVGHGVAQTVTAAGTGSAATASFTNNGSLTVAAMAKASAP